MTPEQKAVLKAAKSGDLETVKTLVGQDPSLLNATDSDGSTPLHCAAWKGHAPLVAWLRAHARMTRRGAQRLRSVSARLRSLPVGWQAYA